MERERRDIAADTKLQVKNSHQEVTLAKRGNPGAEPIQHNKKARTDTEKHKNKDSSSNTHTEKAKATTGALLQKQAALHTLIKNTQRWNQSVSRNTPKHPTPREKEQNINQIQKATLGTNPK